MSEEANKRVISHIRRRGFDPILTESFSLRQCSPDRLTGGRDVVLVYRAGKSTYIASKLYQGYKEGIFQRL